MRKQATALKLLAAAILIGANAVAPAQVPYSNRCFTPQFWCYMGQPFPVGSRCFCGTPYGPVYGVVR